MGFLMRQNFNNQYEKKGPSMFRIIFIGIIIMAITLLVISIFVLPDRLEEGDTVYKAEYPTQTEPPNVELSSLLTDSIKQFAADSVPKTLGTKQGNRLYSPVSLYSSLLMLSSLSSGETKAEILAALNKQTNVDEQAQELFSALYYQGEQGGLVLGNSLWINTTIEVNKAYLQQTGEQNYLTSYQIGYKSGSSRDKVARWLRHNSNNRLGVRSAAYSFSNDQYFSLVGSLYYQAQWQKPFNPQDSLTTSFGENEVTYMKKTEVGSYWQDDNYRLGSMELTDGNKMVFILPDENTTTDSLLAGTELIDDICKGRAIDRYAYNTINWTVPKFSLIYEWDLIDCLKNLGVENAFANNADFSPLTANSPAFFGGGRQSVVISVDENGCESYNLTLNSTGQDIYTPSGEPKTLELTRPFIVMVLTKDNLPLYIGVVENPLYQ